MQITNEKFFEAKKSKYLSFFSITGNYVSTTGDYAADTLNRTSMKGSINLTLEIPVNFSEETHNVIIKADVDIRIENYSKYYSDKKRDINAIVFGMFVYRDSHVRTFLNAIKKNSKISFLVTAYNSNDNWDKVNFVSHQLYGIVDGQKYFLDYYIGPDNSASPVK